MWEKEEMAAVRIWKVANVGIGRDGSCEKMEGGKCGIRGDGSCEKMEGGKCGNRRRWQL